MISNLSSPARQMFWGDVLLVGCCVFYLLWWAVAFKPTGAVKGLRSGWLLIPAFALGIAAVLRVVRGAIASEMARSFFSIRSVLLVAALAYVVLLVLTRLLFHRQVTSELLLIVAWTVLALVEVNALYGAGLLPRSGALGLLVAAVIVAAVSMVCYVLYYDLTGGAAYLDGMLPLLLVALFMAALAALIVVSAR